MLLVVLLLHASRACPALTQPLCSANRFPAPLCSLCVDIVSQKLLQNLVLEKERRTREGMKMMGLKGNVLNLGWFLTYGGL